MLDLRMINVLFYNAVEPCHVEASFLELKSVTCDLGLFFCFPVGV